MAIPGGEMKQKKKGIIPPTIPKKTRSQAHLLFFGKKNKQLGGKKKEIC